MMTTTTTTTTEDDRTNASLHFTPHHGIVIARRFTASEDVDS